jgi:hypothetical protein
MRDSIRSLAKKQYYELTENDKEWPNKQYRTIVEGKRDSNTEVFSNKYDDIRRLIFSEKHRFLIEHTI